MAEILNPIPQGENVEIERTEEFKRTAKELSDFMLALPLTDGQHTKLIALLTTHVLTAEREAFSQGIRLAQELYETD